MTHDCRQVHEFLVFDLFPILPLGMAFWLESLLHTRSESLASKPTAKAFVEASVEDVCRRSVSNYCILTAGPVRSF